jgi:DNA polymerase V
MTVVGLRLKQELMGIPCLDINQIQEPKKEIGTAKQFGVLQTNYEYIKEALSSYVDYCAGKLRRQNSVASAILVHLETNAFRTQDEQYYNRTVITLDVASSDSNYLIKNATNGLQRIFKPGLKYKRVGVSLIGLFPDNCVQQNLFVNTNPKHIAVQKVIDKLNMKYEQGTVRSASCGYNKQHWESKASARTQRYTTRLNELLKIGNDVLQV